MCGISLLWVASSNIAEEIGISTILLQGVFTAKYCGLDII